MIVQLVVTGRRCYERADVVSEMSLWWGNVIGPSSHPDIEFHSPGYPEIVPRSTAFNIDRKTIAEFPLPCAKHSAMTRAPAMKLPVFIRSHPTVPRAKPPLMGSQEPLHQKTIRR